MHLQSPSDRSKCAAYNSSHSSLNVHQVVGLTLFDLRRREKVDQLGMVGVNGSKFPAIRQHLQENIGQVYKDMDTSCVQHRFSSLPRPNSDIPFRPQIRKLPRGEQDRPRGLYAAHLVIRPCFSSQTPVLFSDKAAIDQLKPGDAVIVFTPDSTQQL